MALSVDTLNNYIKLDNQIHELEIKNTRKAYEELQGRLGSLQTENKTLKQQLEEKCQKTKKELDDVERVVKEMEQAVLAKGQKQYDEEMAREKAEHLEALAEQEKVQKFLEENEKEIKQVEKQAAEAKVGNDQLNKLYQEQEELLNSIFNGSYGSALENELEADLEMHRERKQRIDIARYKWTNGRVLLSHACNQLNTATKGWTEMRGIKCDIQKRYQEVTPVRNNLLAAIQNMQSAHKYLDNIPFPYCKQDEIDTLSHATANIYTDMTSEDRSIHAGECFSTTYKRCAALLQWFDTVINTTITKDLREATDNAAEAEKHLRAERMRLLKEMADKQNVVFNVDESVKHKDESQGMQGSDIKPVGDVQEDNTPAPVQRNIAALPSQDEIFGNMEELKKKHDQRIGEYQKIEEMNKARVAQGLEEKLAQRRQRRMEQRAS
ncbi:GRIP1-associated protein 1-like isoform X2 [Argopecten irradians]|uniref:GRIP1-associated protein 1-like isoform X2 n=1 Tax=Argopecten irradians TaxID=31199 RepID=UPI003713DDFA